MLTVNPYVDWRGTVQGEEGPDQKVLLACQENTRESNVQKAAQIAELNRYYTMESMCRLNYLSLNLYKNWVFYSGIMEFPCRLEYQS